MKWTRLSGRNMEMQMTTNKLDENWWGTWEWEERNGSCKGTHSLYLFIRNRWAALTYAEILCAFQEENLEKIHMTTQSCQCLNKQVVASVHTTRADSSEQLTSEEMMSHWLILFLWDPLDHTVIGSFRTIYVFNGTKMGKKWMCPPFTSCPMLR